MKDSGISPSEFEESDGLSELERELASVLEEDDDELEDESIAEITLEELHTMLDQALKNENYEEAAKIRDEINKRT
jgi:uncharacterized protein